MGQKSVLRGFPIYGTHKTDVKRETLGISHTTKKVAFSLSKILLKNQTLTPCPTVEFLRIALGADLVLTYISVPLIVTDHLRLRETG
jgi:hypothetical protein